MRDALALLDQISVLGANKEITTDDINELLGKISFDKLYEITQYILNADSSKSVALIDEVYAKGNEPVQLVNNIIQYFRDLMITKNCSDKELVFSLTQINEMNYAKAKEQCDKFSLDEIIVIIDKLSYYATQIKDTTNKYLWLEICIMDITNYKNLPSIENLQKRIENLEAQISNGTIPHQQVKTDAAPVNKPAVQPIINNEPVKTVHREVNNTPVVQEETKKEKPPIQEPIEKTNSDNAKNVSTDIHNLWVSVIQSISSLTAKAYYQKAYPVELSENKIVIAFQNELFIKMADKNKKQALLEAITSYLGFKNPVLEIILMSEIGENTLKEPLNTNIKPPLIEEKQEEENDVQKQEEEEYHKYVEAKKEEENKPQNPQKPLDTSSQANMIKDLFDGKFIE